MRSTRYLQFLNLTLVVADGLYATLILYMAELYIDKEVVDPGKVPIAVQLHTFETTCSLPTVARPPKKRTPFVPLPRTRMPAVAVALLPGGRGQTASTMALKVAVGRHPAVLQAPRCGHLAPPASQLFLPTLGLVLRYSALQVSHRTGLENAAEADAREAHLASGFSAEQLRKAERHQLR